MTKTSKYPSPLKSIRLHCLSCAGRPKEVRECSTTKCSLYRFRTGHNPARAGIGPGIGTTRAISKGILANPPQVYGENTAFKEHDTASGGKAAVKASVAKIDTQGRVTIRAHGNAMIIRVVQDK
jgi:hypothetical protein